MVRLEFKLEIGRSHPRSSSRSRSLSPDSDRIPLVDRSSQQQHPREDPASISLPPSPTSEKLLDALSSPPPKGYHRVTSSETDIPGNDTQPLVKGPPGGGGGPGKPPSGDGGKPAEPYTEFSPWRRKFILAVITTAGFFGPLAGGIYLPALPVLTKEFNATPTAINVSVTVFMATFAVGPLFWSTFADWKGRRPLYLISLFIYIVANILLAAVPANYGALVFLRIVQAFGSAAVVSMGAGTVADITGPKRRAFAMSIFLMGPQCGPIIGPLLGGALAEADWRWMFGFLAISGAALWLVILFCLPETLRARVGSGRIYKESSKFFWPPRLSSPLAPAWERGPPPPKPTLKMYWNLFIYPPIGIVTVNTAMLYSTYFAITINLPIILSEEYKWRTIEIGGGFGAVGVALILGSLLGGRVSDWRRAGAVKKAPDGKVDPEFRLVDQIWGVLVCVGGTIMYGWVCEFQGHPALILLATFLAGFGMNWVFVTTTAFLTECVAQQAAGAFALGNLLRNPGAAIAAVIIPSLVVKMGHGWCYTGLALLDLVLVGSAVMILKERCPGWRAEREAKMKALKAKGGPGGPGGKPGP
ncbi:putative transporter [Cladorrhinum samala]|uniref:Transporter n=1 Tax=Cladorrhinum samala TaxID=585594 RepID=A0AAV9HJC2_9PEZI|nr:putative transporter [Cladorrhinum samala]